jgi:hypothetical protein
MADTGKSAADKVTVSVRDGIVWVELRGEINFQDSVNAMRAASAAAHEHVADRLVFDLRASHHVEFHAMTLESARMAPDMGLSTALRGAIIGHEGDPRLAFIEDVATNRGFKLRAFTDPQQAIAWLKASRG